MHLKYFTYQSTSAELCRGILPPPPPAPGGGGGGGAGPGASGPPQESSAKAKTTYLTIFSSLDWS